MAAPPAFEKIALLQIIAPWTNRFLSRKSQNFTTRSEPPKEEKVAVASSR